MIRALPWLALCGAVAARGATAPDWARAAALLPVPPSVTVALVANSTRVVYLSPDHTQRTVRWAVKQGRVEDRVAIRFVSPYSPNLDRLLDVRAWIIGADGKVQAFKRSDFADVSGSTEMLWTTDRALLFDGNGRVPLGGTLACEVQTEQPATVYEAMDSFQSPFYAVEEDFEVVPPSGYTLAWHATSASVAAPIPLADPGGLRWEMRHVRPNRSERDPGGFLANPLLVTARPEPAEHSSAWLEMARRAHDIMEPRIEQTPAIAAMAARLTAGKASRWERIRALTEFVQQDVVYLELNLQTDCLAGFRPNPASEVLRNRFGDCKDKASLLIALLRSVGEDGHILLLYAGGGPEVVGRDWPTLSYFNHAIVAIANDAGAPSYWPRLEMPGGPPMIAFDPTDSVTPLGVLSNGDQGGWALLVDSERGCALKLPQSRGDFHRVDRMVDASLDDSGALTVAIDAQYHGLPAASEYRIRRALDSERFKRRLATLLQSSAPSIQDLAWTDHWDPAGAEYELHQNFRAQQFGRLLGADLMEIQPHILPPFSTLPAWETSAEGVSWISTGVLRDRIRIRLPAGFAVDEFPPDWDKHGALISCRLHYAIGQGAAVYESDFSLQPGFYSKEQYESIRRFFDSFREAQRRPVLLRRTAAPAAAHS
ncbi:MAG TPA: transglutaminase family protein [Opitutaceae bacterium]|jgi:transglutaminase-like putative cysteine protease|nr:transglutaminase family protein [Opitutaceae bacterium]